MSWKFGLWTGFSHTTSVCLLTANRFSEFTERGLASCQTTSALAVCLGHAVSGSVFSLTWQNTLNNSPHCFARPQRRELLRTQETMVETTMMMMTETRAPTTILNSPKGRTRMILRKKMMTTTILRNLHILRLEMCR